MMKESVAPTLVDSIAQSLFEALPIFRKRLIHMDVIQREHNMPLSHVQVLALLKDNGTMTVSEISRRLGIAKPNITPLVDRLIAAGYVMRSRDSQDRRMVRVSICPAGEEKLAAIRSRMTELVGEWAEKLSGQDLQTLKDSLCNVRRILTAARD